MTELTIAIEGFDGAGKTTLAQSLASAIALDGFNAIVVGKGANDASPAVEALTHTIKSLEGRRIQLNESAQVHLRLARQIERHAISRQAQIAVLDRWLLSDLAYLGTTRARADFLAETESLHLVADLTLFLSAPFELEWARIEGRTQARSPREQLGVPDNRRLHERTESLARASMGTPFGHLVILDSTQSPAEVLREAQTYWRTAIAIKPNTLAPAGEAADAPRRLVRPWTDN